MSGPDRHPIVIVDDVPEIREILAFLLEESGWFRVAGEAGTADGALAIVKRVRPDAVLLDLDLPDRPAWEILDELREVAPATKIVVLTGLARDHDLDRLVRGRADAIIDKASPNRSVISALLDALGSGSIAPAVPTAASVVPLELSSSIGVAEQPLAAAMATSAIDAVVVIDAAGCIRLWNAAAEAMTGRPAGTVLGRQHSVLVPGDRPDDLARLRALLSPGDPPLRLESQWVHARGDRLDVAISAVLSGNDLCLAVRDLSARRHTDEALARALTQLDRRNRELRRSNAELDSFAAVASHDLAQPLQVAIGFLDMLRVDYGPLLTAPGDRWLDQSVASLDRMRQLVQDILRWSRTGAGQPLRDPVELGSVVEDVLHGLADMIEDRGAEALVGRLPVVAGDRAQLLSVFQNLLVNAFKFVPADRRPRVEVTAEATADEVVVSVRDNGIGIPFEARARVFEMFGRSVDAGAFEGSGIGLAIVKKIVGRHGGAVWVGDAPEGGDQAGTTMCVRLPAV